MDIPSKDDVLEEYGPMVTKLLTECPLYPPDPRQQAFFKTTDRLRADGFKEEAIPMNGFPAACVDLGWLKERGRGLVKELFEPIGPWGLAFLVEMLVENCVQRVKSLTIHPDEERATLEIQFKTRGDFGYYEYRMAISLLNDDALIQDQPPEE